MQPQLYVGNRNYSSWSLRAWLALQWARIDFDETRVELDQPGYGECGIAQVLAVSPSGMVPALRIGDEVIWDTLAIAEWAAENTRGQPLVPADSLERAAMRSTIGEMHAGFAALRQELPMNIRRRCRASGLSAQARRDVQRIDALWSSLRQRYAGRGAFLFGPRTLSDAFYLPVATRFRTYSVELSPPASAYVDELLRDAAFRRWEDQVLADPPRPFSRAPIDSVFPGSDIPHGVAV